MLELAGVTLRYRANHRQITAAYQVQLKIAEGERVILLGPSGCGKSSLLKAMGGFIAPAEGTVLFRGRPVRGPDPQRMTVFQEFDQLFPWKTVLQNVAFPLMEAEGLPRREAEMRASVFVDRVKLGRFANAYPHELSGGMKQRVAIARCLVTRPPTVLMDEPFAALDALTRRQMQDEVLSLWTESKFTLVFVTHSISEALTLGTRIVVLSPHPGQVREIFNVPTNVTADKSPLNANGLADERCRIQRDIDRLLHVDAIEAA